MSLDADHIVDRRRMRRKLTVWRIVAILAARSLERFYPAAPPAPAEVRS